MQILLTSIAGFIGYHLAEKLIGQNCLVVGLDNINDYYNVSLKISRLNELGFKKDKISYGKIIKSSKEESLNFIQLNLNDRENLQNLFSKQNFTHVVNLAAQAGVRYSIENPFSYVDSNLVGFVNILECCRNYEIEHLVFASSSSVYGHNKKIPFSEKDSVDYPVSLYAATKKSNELMAYTYSYLYGFQTTGLRFFTVYGPWGRPDMAPMLFANAITNGQPIKVFNNGAMKRDFTYVDDIVEGIVKSIYYKNAKTPAYEIFNIGNSKPVDLMQFIECMENELGIKADKIMMPMQPGDVKVTYADTSSLNEHTGYSPNIDLEEGLHSFVKWYMTYYKK